MNSLWERYQKHLFHAVAPLDLAIDISRMRFDDAFFGPAHLPLQSEPAEDTFKA
ncbi:MAG TPA: hypothetical protein VGH90_05795 [Chthoniobacteraceae bacterium]|jgi:hypothetical protein